MDTNNSQEESKKNISSEPSQKTGQQKRKQFLQNANQLQKEEQQLQKTDVTEISVEKLCEEQDGEKTILKNKQAKITTFFCKDVDGVFVITNYKFQFVPKQQNYLLQQNLPEDFFKIPLTYIQEFSKNEGNFFQLQTCDYRDFKVEYFGDTDTKILVNIEQIIFQKNQDRQVFAFIYADKKLNSIQEQNHYNKNNQGWNVYNGSEQGLIQQMQKYANLGENWNNFMNKYKIIENKNYELCKTYPKFLIVPKQMSDENLVKCSNFRTKERIPTLIYVYNLKNNLSVTLWRSSQNKSGFFQQSKEDELMLKYIGNSNYQEGQQSQQDQSKNLHIYDARPKVNAEANKFQKKGGGYENPDNYKNCDIFFMNIQNIHKVKKAHKGVLEACKKQYDSNKFLSEIENTSWLQFLSSILLAGNQIVQDSLKKGFQVLVHCSDGWDRTSQLISLAQILIDPQFRTLNGFSTLVQKDWMFFGHQFETRTGTDHNKLNLEQISPIFIQFLDVIHQLLIQFPQSFEFNNQFLLDIAYHLYSTQFGNFLYNCEREYMENQANKYTISLWDYLEEHKDKYKNELYCSEKSKNLTILKPDPTLKAMRLWKEYFFYYTPFFKNIYKLGEQVTQFSVDELIKQIVMQKNEEIKILQELLANTKDQMKNGLNLIYDLAEKTLESTKN